MSFYLYLCLSLQIDLDLDKVTDMVNIRSVSVLWCFFVLRKT